MSQLSASQQAGRVLRELIQQYYSSQEEFAYDFGVELRTVSRYINQGITKVDVIQEMAEFFSVDFACFFREI